VGGHAMLASRSRSMDRWMRVSNQWAGVAVADGVHWRRCCWRLADGCSRSGPGARSERLIQHLPTNTNPPTPTHTARYIAHRNQPAEGGCTGALHRRRRQGAGRHTASPRPMVRTPPPNERMMGSIRFDQTHTKPTTLPTPLTMPHRPLPASAAIRGRARLRGTATTPTPTTTRGG
jgi:hypothetical protein